jgi:hypothetical protein
MSAPTGSEARTGPFSGHITRLEPSIDHAQVGCFCVIDHAGMRKIVDHAHARATDHAAKTDVWTGSNNNNNNNARAEDRRKLINSCSQLVRAVGGSCSLRWSDDEGLSRLRVDYKFTILSGIVNSQPKQW